MCQENTVSVIMPTYNTNPAYLREAIDSILNQTHRDLELIVVDDCSTRRDVDQVIAGYQDERLRYFPMPENRGAGATRNFGLDQAKGSYIAFLDSDDIAVPERLAKQVAFLRENPDIGIVGSALVKFPKRKYGRVVSGDKEIRACAMFLRAPAAQSSVMLRKDMLDASGVRYEDDLSQDYAFWLDLTFHMKSENINEALLMYRWHGDNISIVKARRQYVMNRKIVMSRWERHYGVSVPQQVVDFLLLDLRDPAELPVVERFFRELMERIRQDDYTDPQRAVRYLGKLYRKTVRKYPSGRMIRALLALDLSRDFALDVRFRLEMYCKSLLMREKEL